VIPAAELHRLEQLLMVFPRAIHLQLQVQNLRARIAREKESKARALRGEIRRQLMAADANTLVQVAQQLRSVS
jgi:hypothetical protein